MQIIEVTDLAIRSAVITMRRKDTPLTFVLFPMIHVASPAFYAQVRSRLAACDLIVVEGIRGRSRRLRAITLVYRLAPRRRRFGLVVQEQGALLPDGVPVVNPDATAAETLADLKELPRWRYLLVLVAAPVMGLVFAVRGPRAFFNEDLAIEDLPRTLSAELEAETSLRHALSDRRDRLLLDALTKIYRERCEEPGVVAVLYGAGHIPAATAGLMERHGYRPRAAEWLTLYVPR